MPNAPLARAEDTGLTADLDPLSIVDPSSPDWPASGGSALSETIGSVSPYQLVPASLPGSVAAADVETLLGAFSQGALSPSAALASLITAISATRTGREAVLRLVPGAKAAAAESDARWKAGNPRPLEGIPFGVKDIIDVEGAVVTSGSLFTGNRIAPADAAAVARLRAAGAIPFAMTATTEFAAGSPHNPRFGVVTNPWNAARWTGGSSTGSGAALAARLMPLAIGTDTGGSIRVPSCWCGTTGFKPTRELVSREGVAPLSWTLDHVGPMARSARDLARVLPFMTALPNTGLLNDCRAVLSNASVRGVRIGVPEVWFTDHVDNAVLANWQSALARLEGLGCMLVPFPALDIEAWHEAGWVILQSELATLHGTRLDRAELFDRGMLHRLNNGLQFSAVDYGRALQLRAEARAAFVRAMQGIDLIVTAGLGGEAGRLEDLTVVVNDTAHAFQSVISRNTMIFDVTGLPALMLPSGLGRTGLPTGIQVVGRPGDDALCLSLGAAFQAVTGFHHATPAGQM
ncbi:amidase [Rhizobium glycinendophyticum]|uniref:amidase n=1 Tax=Rhizobium glycinendophyticum TaxID=2589807 RepID=UPI00137567AE|nr:amidase [Rhizobium glycinendophyticum]